MCMINEIISGNMDYNVVKMRSLSQSTIANNLYISLISDLFITPSIMRTSSLRQITKRVCSRGGHQFLIEA